jgi:hypothetical protein
MVVGSVTQAKKIEVSIETILAVIAGILPPHQNKLTEYVVLVNFLTGKTCSQYNSNGLLFHAVDARDELIRRSRDNEGLRKILTVTEFHQLPVSTSQHDRQHWIKEILMSFSRETMVSIR